MQMYHSKTVDDKHFSRHNRSVYCFALQKERQALTSSHEPKPLWDGGVDYFLLNIERSVLEKKQCDEGV
jgi:hypothetical protein